MKKLEKDTPNEKALFFLKKFHPQYIMNVPERQLISKHKFLNLHKD